MTILAANSNIRPRHFAPAFEDDGESGSAPRSSDRMLAAVAELAPFADSPVDAAEVERMVERIEIVETLLARFKGLSATRRRLNRCVVVEAGSCAESLLADALPHAELLPVMNQAARAFIEATTAMADLDYDAARIFSVASVIDRYLGASTAAAAELLGRMTVKRRLRTVPVYAPTGPTTSVMLDGVVVGNLLESSDAEVLEAGLRASILDQRDALGRTTDEAQSVVIGGYEALLARAVTERIAH